MGKKSTSASSRNSRIGKRESAHGTVDNRVVWAPRWDDLGLVEHPVRLQGGLLGVCTAGSCRLSVNMKRYDLETGSLLVVFPGSIVRSADRSDDFRISPIAFSTDFLRGAFQSVGPLYPHIFQNPVLALTEEDVPMLLRYVEMLGGKTQRQGHIYTREILSHLMLALFHEISALYQRKHPKADRKLTRDEEIFKRLMQLVVQHFREERRTAFYARALCLTPKYLSTVVKRVSNKSVAEWIGDAVILEAKSQLRSTQMTVQQIANSLNFPNPSFFGRFFKKHTGMTPKAYRECE